MAEKTFQPRQTSLAWLVILAREAYWAICLRRTTVQRGLWGKLSVQASLKDKKPYSAQTKTPISTII